MTKRLYHLQKIVMLLFICCPQQIFAQAPIINFKHISIESGLSNSTVECIYQDTRGFLWFGTRNGLNRFDGNQMQVYRHLPNDSNSICDDFIKYIYEDQQCYLWMGTSNGLSRFNPVTGTFTTFKHNTKIDNSLSNNSITSIVEIPEAGLWVATLGGGINVFLPGQSGFVHYKRHAGITGYLPGDSVYCMYFSVNKKLWMGTDQGLILYEPATKTFRDIKTFANEASKNKISVIKENAKGQLLLGTENNGLYLYNPQNDSLQKFQHKEKDPASLASNQVRAILTDKKNNIWIGAINGGLDLLTEGSNIFYHYQNKTDNPQSLSQRTVSALLEDHQGNLWIGTHRGGVNLFCPSLQKFSLYRQEVSGNSLSYNDVKTFCEDKQGNIWIGTDGGGLNKFNRETNEFQHFRFNPFNNKSIGSNEILSVYEDKAGNLWAGTWGGGLCLYNGGGNQFIRYTHNNKDSNSISSNYIQQIFEDSKQNLWIATYYGGLNIFNRQTKTFSKIPSASNTRDGIVGKNIVSLAEDKLGNIWAGTDDGGLNCIRISNKKISHYFTQLEKMPDLRAIFVDSRNRIWVGQQGLFLYDPARDSFALFNENAGLSGSFIKGILEDENGNLWISSSNGICTLNPASHWFKKYNLADGLQGTEFEANAAMRTRDGEIYFGGTNGFNAFYPHKIIANAFVPPVYITGFWNNNDQELAQKNKHLPISDISYLSTITTRYSQSGFSFVFAALNYSATENNQYKFKLEGWDKNWISAGNEGKASYGNVSPGTYFFKVIASNNDGVWNEQGTTLQIIITPPFWATWWFRLIALLVIVLLLAGYYHARQKRQIELLEEKKKEEIYQLQLQFFTNISHEFRTPLSLIIGPIEALARDNKNLSLQPHFQLIQKNAKRLLQLINELMDFRKAESGVLKLNVLPGHITPFLQEIAAAFSAWALEKNIRFTLDLPAIQEPMWFDRQILEKIIINIIGNAFKYTHKNGNIEVAVLGSMADLRPLYENELILRSGYAGKKYIYIKVSDTGIGISKESIKHLFERYYRISEQHMGSGIGLAFVKSLTGLHKGDIYVYSERNKGTELIIGIPVSKMDYQPNEQWIPNSNAAGAKMESLQESVFESENETEEASLLLADPSATKPVILLVEDNAELRFFLRECLSPFYDIEEAEDGHQGLQKAKETMPDLIISDIMMPEMDGIEFCKCIKEELETSHIPFVMLTAKNAAAARMEGLDTGADLYFSKPLSIPYLLLTLRNLFRQKQRLKEHYLKDQYAEAKELAHSAVDKAFLEELINIIEAHLVNPEMDVDYICMNMGMSKTKLYQKIKKISGQSIGEFIRTIRFKKAAQLMTTQDIPLSEVMYSVGIQTQSYFTKAFKAAIGKTPTQFLKDLKKD